MEQNINSIQQQQQIIYNCYYTNLLMTVAGTHHIYYGSNPTTTMTSFISYCMHENNKLSALFKLNLFETDLYNVSQFKKEL